MGKSLEERRAACRKYHADHKEQANARRRGNYRKEIVQNPNYVKEKYRGASREKTIQRSRAWRKANPKRRSEWARLYATGCSPEEYATLFTKQSGQCVICGEGHPVLCADHDHNTGKIRGLLCKKCNWGLGQFRDSIGLLKNARRYLEYADAG